VVAISDVAGATYNPKGLDVEALVAHSREGGAISEFPGGEPVDGEEMLTLDCEVLVPCATANQITRHNADKIKARLIAEGANGPTTPTADAILAERNIFVIPDILCNAGGVYVSYLEYTQETQREQMTLEEVEERLRQRMERCFFEVLARAEQRDLTMRTAALEISISRLAEATIARGFQP
jgi:glutamate dehydrogenase/leucine dehydrogenase